MPSSAEISSISTPFPHSVTSTSVSGFSDNTTFIIESFKISNLVADFIGPLPQGTFQNVKKVLQSHQVNGDRGEKEDFQVGFDKNLLEEIFESVHVCSIAKDVPQTDAKGRNGNKLKRKLHFLSKVFELVSSKTTQSIIIHECDLMARVVRRSKARMSQNQLYIIYSFIMRSCPLFNISFQSKEHFNNLFLNLLHKTPFLKEHQLWHSDAALQFDGETKNLMELKSKISKNRQVFEQNKFKEYSDDNLADDKCSTASRSSITTHERNFEINDIDSGNFLEFNPRFSEVPSPPRYSEFFACSAYDGFQVGDLEINFTPCDNLLSCFEEEKSTHLKQPYSQNNLKNKNVSNQAKTMKKNIPELHTAKQGPQISVPNHQKALEFKLFTVPNFNFDPRFCLNLSATEPKYQTKGHSAENSKKAKDTSSSSSNANIKTKITQKPKAKKPQDKSIKLWDMISVNGKLKKK